MKGKRIPTKAPKRSIEVLSDEKRNRSSSLEGEERGKRPRLSGSRQGEFGDES